MIELPPLQSSTISTNTREQLAAAIAEMLAHIYCYAGIELAKMPPDPANEQLLDQIFDAVAKIDDASGGTSGPIVREVLGG